MLKRLLRLIFGQEKPITEIKQPEETITLTVVEGTIHERQIQHDNTQEIEVIPCTPLHDVPLPTPEVKSAITRPQDRIKNYVCDMCKSPAKHISILKSGIGDLVIGAKCNVCIEHVLNARQGELDHNLQGLTKINTHAVGFKATPYNKWYECSCPQKQSHWKYEFNRIKKDIAPDAIDVV